MDTTQPIANNTNNKDHGMSYTQFIETLTNNKPNIANVNAIDTVNNIEINIGILYSLN